MAINFITWLWGGKYDWTDVVRLAHGIRKHADHRLVVFADRVGPDLPPYVEQRLIAAVDRVLMTRSCFVRLRMFDPIWQRANGFKDRIVSLDLDLVITGTIEPLFETPSSFMILKGANEVNPNPFNASIMMLRPGHHADVWDDFRPDAAQILPHHEFPDDQGWIWHKLPNADGWQAGSQSGIYGFQKPGWPKGSFDLPPDARIVAFIGKRKPRMYESVPWVRRYWIAA